MKMLNINRSLLSSAYGLGIDILVMEMFKKHNSYAVK